MHPFQIGERAADRLCRHFQPEMVIRFQKLIISRRQGRHQALPHGAVGRLPEIPALRMLQVRPPRQKRDPHIRDRRSEQHARMALFLQMRQDQTLPVQIQHIRTADGAKGKTAAAGRRLQQQMHFRIMAQRFVMACAFHGSRDRFLIHDTSGPEFHIDAEPFLYHALQDLDLHLPHDLGLDLSRSLIPGDPQHRLLFLQLAQLRQHPVDITARGQQHLIGEHRLEQRRLLPTLRLRSQCLSSIGTRRPRHRADDPRTGLVHRFIFRAGIDADLIDLFPRFRRTGPLSGAAKRKDIFHPQDPARDLHMRQPAALPVARYLENTRAKSGSARRGGRSPAGSPRIGQSLFRYLCGGLPRGGPLRIRQFSSEFFQPAEQFLHAPQLQRRTEITGEYLPARDHPANIAAAYLSSFQISLQHRLIAHGQFFHRFIPAGHDIREHRFLPVFLRPARHAYRPAAIRPRAAAPLRRQSVKRHTIPIQTFPHIREDRPPVRPCLIHLVDKDKRRQTVPFQQPP